MDKETDYPNLLEIGSLNWYGSTTDIICDWVWYLFLYTPST